MERASNSVGFLPPDPAQVTDDYPGKYIPGGRNVEAYRYFVTPGYPPYPDRAKWAGLLSGNWDKIGETLGARAGDKVIELPPISGGEKFVLLKVKLKLWKP